MGMPNKSHHFDVVEAKKYGPNGAVILANIRFWVEKNKANKKHCVDGRYWTYNSVEAFSQIFDYLTNRQIEYAISKLEKLGVLISGKYNKMKRDRTKWYSLNEDWCLEEKEEEYEEVPISQNCEMEDNSHDKEVPISQNCEMPISQNCKMPFHKIVKPLPYINTYNKPDRKRESSNSKSEGDEILERVITHWNSLPETLKFESNELNTGIQSKLCGMVIRLRREGNNLDDILNAMSNYASLVKSPESWYNGQYTLQSFLGINGRKEQLSKFLPANFDHREYISDKSKNQGEINKEKAEEEAMDILKKRLNDAGE